MLGNELEEAIGQTTVKLNRTVVVSQMPHSDFADRYQVPLLSIDPIRPASSYTYVRRGHYSIESNRLIGADIARWVDGLLDAQFQP